MMSDILVAGFVNVETQVRVERFPIEYTKSRYLFDGTADAISGVALNVSSALRSLGHEVALATTLGTDLMSGVVSSELQRLGLASAESIRVDPSMPTARTVVLSSQADGADAMFTDLKKHQEYVWPDAEVHRLVSGARLVHATNINWGLQFAREACACGVLVSTDIHAIQTLDDEYNRRFLECADIVFVSGERLLQPIDEMIADLFSRFRAQLVVVGLGANGATVGERGRAPIHLPATPLRPIVSATGCGDALAAAFLSCWLRGLGAGESLRRAQVFAGWKLGELGGSKGHLTRARLDELSQT